MSDYTSSPSRPASPVGALPDTQTITPRPFRFNWDTASRVRGPGSVSEATEGRGADYFGVAPRLDPFGASSSNLTAGSLPNEWSSSKQGFNAISTVLNNPHRKQAPPKAHSSLPAVPPADLPRVKRKDFDSYLRAVGPEWDKFQRNLQPDVDDQTRPEQSSTTPRSSLNTPHTPVSTKPFTPLNSVPQIFFDPHFNLGDPRTFGVVTERGNAEEDADPLLPSYALPLLERLSHHADTIEQHLVREISARSSSFFAALSNLQDLQTESEECLDRVSKLRGLLNDVDEKGAKRGLHIVTRQSKQRNLAAVHEGIKEVESVVEMTGVAKGLVVAGQWGEALGIIEDVEALWDPRPLKPPLPLSRKNSRQSLLSNGNGRLSPLPPTPESPPPETDAASVTRFSNASIPLSSLQAFSSLPDQLRTLTMEIASSLTTDLVTALKLDLRERATFTPEAPVDEVTLKDRLRPLLQGLSRTKGLREATISWREIVNLEMRGIIGQHLPSLEFDEDELKSPKTPPNGASTHLRGLSYEDSMHLVSALYRSTVNALSGLQTQNSTFTDVLSGLESRYSIDIPSIREELADIMSSAADLVNKILAKLIGYRADQHAQLELPQFLTFFNESWSFVVTCETICRRMIMGLRGTLLGQAKTFLQTFHQARISQSARLVEDEQWSQTEVAPSLQQLVGILVDSAVRDSPELIIKPVTASASPSSPVNGSASPSPKANGPGASSKYLHIEEHPFFCVSATGAVLALLLDYLKVVVNLSVLNTDTMSRVIEFLKAFNSRTCQVVLGAGAMRSAGLRNITAKHLALASQSLSIMVMLIPYVRETFRRHLSQTQAVMLVEFDKLKRDFQEHQNEIHSKLIAIMSDRISAHVKSLQAVDWTVPKEGANSYMELLVKETVTLYKVLSRYLTTQVVEYVMSQVFAAINHRLSEEYGNIELSNQDAKNRMLADARFLNEKLSVLKNVNAPTDLLEKLVSEKAFPGFIAANSSPVTNNGWAPPTANERIRGLFSRRDSAKPVSVPNGSLSPSPPPPPPSISTTNANPSLITEGVSPPPRGSSRMGFRQVLEQEPADIGDATPTPRDEAASSGLAIDGENRNGSDTTAATAAASSVENPDVASGPASDGDPAMPQLSGARGTEISADGRQSGESEVLLSPVQDDDVARADER